MKKRLFTSDFGRLCWFYSIFCTSLSIFYPGASSSEALTVTETLSDDVELLVTKYTAQGDYLVIWIAAASGFKTSHNEMAEILAQRNIEVWQTDLLESQFLPKATASLKQQDGQFVSELISIAHAKSNKKIVLMSNSYGAIPVLRGIRHWQKRQNIKAKVVGSILFSPSLYQTIPPLGVAPEYLPIAHASNSPIYIFQSARHGTRWQLSKLVEILRQSGSPVYTEILPDVGSIFFRQEDLLVKRTFLKVAFSIESRIRLLDNNKFPAHAVDIQEPDFRPILKSGLDNILTPYRGKTKPFAINLMDVNGNRYVKTDFRNQVTVINFWASWCSPCIKEIPSLNNLLSKMAGKPFELISINYAEEQQAIVQFMQTVKVDFPVLLDADGSVAAKWLVVAFPSTYVIAPDGTIHFGVNAGIEWDTDEVLNKINNLYKK